MVVLNVLNDRGAEQRAQVLSSAAALSYIGGTERHQGHVQVQMRSIVPFRRCRLCWTLDGSVGDGQLGPRQNLITLMPMNELSSLIQAQHHEKFSA